MTDHYLWKPLTVVESASVLAGFDAPWWIAGGVAIDLFVGRETRAHGDLDIAMLRGDEPGLRDALPSWDIKIAHDGAFLEWDGSPLRPEHHQFWARPEGSEAWAFEILLEQHDRDRWIYRRDARLLMPLDAIGRMTNDGIPFLAPEVALLYKSSKPDYRSNQNQHDFDVALPLLDADARSWLGSALEVVSPQHPWRGRLAET